jgi:carbamate kinase
VQRDMHGQLHGVEAVVDKDAASAVLACGIGADFFVMLTDVGGIYADYGSADARLIASTGANALVSHLPDLPETGMRPKARAAIDFARRTGKPAAIGLLQDLPGILEGWRGTLVSPDAGPFGLLGHRMAS